MSKPAEIVVPSDYTRAGNRSHMNRVVSIPQDEQFSYGTAGFRFDAEKLPFIVFRCAYVASLRARQLNSTIGLMITASHNPAQDNGVKLVDPSGDMLNEQWEIYATEIVNASDEQLPFVVRALEKQIMVLKTIKSRVICGIDTRESGLHLAECARAGAALFNVPFEFYDVVTTPMLHYAVKCHNEPEFGKPTHNEYYSTIAKSFNDLWELTDAPEGSRYEKTVRLDCANGVGGPRFQDMLKHIPSDRLEIVFSNFCDPQKPNLLNHNCGADFVKIQQTLPANFDAGVPNEPKCVSFDGDADRVIYFRSKPDENCPNKVELCDGDKIAVLIATYIREQLKVYESMAPRERLTMGIVQTAYANGSSTRYIREQLGIEPIIVPTGVKHLHEAASEFDVGIYFEANGHGTVVFSEVFDRIIRRTAHSAVALRRLALFSRVINETVGDAIADLLAVEIILYHKGWSMQDWLDQLYQDVPNVQIKVPVDDRSIFKTTNAEQKLVKPEGIQKLIDEDVAKYKNSRAFIRPSGTENIVRVYAEADTVENTLRLGKSLEKVVLGLRNA